MLMDHFGELVIPDGYNGFGFTFSNNNNNGTVKVERNNNKTTKKRHLYGVLSKFSGYYSNLLWPAGFVPWLQHLIITNVRLIN